MTRPAFLVEGDLEQKFIQSACPGVPVRKINCNGDGVAITAITKRVGSLARLVHKRCSHIVVFFDREGRDESVEQIHEQFMNAIHVEGIDAKIILGIADRCIETWIVADEEVFRDKACIDYAIDCVEGKKGDAFIRKCLGERKYDKTIEGVAWLKACRPVEIAKRSPSFKRFLSELGEVDCWWLNR